MKVKTATSAGFCMGVKKAMDIVLEKVRTSKLPICTFGPLIHNPQVLASLKQKGVNILENVKELKKLNPTMVIVRTHGISPAERKELKKYSASFVDGTCPRVAKVQGIIKKRVHDGNSIVIIGDERHAEVTALLSYTDKKGYVIDGPDSVKKLPAMGKVCVVSQTTQSRDNFNASVNALKKRYPSIEVRDTLCDFTSRRQAEVRTLAKEVDALVVVGGKNSANTGRLAMIAKETKKPTYWVESEAELDPEQMKKYFTVGVTAGASTPNWIINRVVETLEDTIPFGEKRWKAFFKRVSSFLARSSLFLAMGAVIMTYVSSTLQSVPFNIFFALTSFFYFASMHIIAYYFEQDSMKYNEPSWYAFFQKYKGWLLLFGILSALGSIYFAYQAGRMVLSLIIFACLMGGIYETNLLPRQVVKWTGFKKFKYVPASKDFSVSLAWSLVVTLIPIFGTPTSPVNSGTFTAFTFTFTLMFFRSIIYDIKDIQGDAFVSRETIPILVGKKKSKQILIMLVFCQSLILLFFAAQSPIHSLGYYLLISMVYSIFCLYLFHKKIISRGNNIRFFIDGQFFLAGASTIVWKFFNPHVLYAKILQ